MKKQFLFAYALSTLLLVWSLVAGNFEFLFYAITALVLTWILHWSDKHFAYSGLVLRGFNLWLILHILGGLFVVGGEALYSKMLLPLVGEPYLILKYDQVVHVYCYFIVALLMWSVVSKIGGDKSTAHKISLYVITVLAATGVGGLNEIIEFMATIFIQDVNVGGYENTAIDIVANTLGALLAIPFFKKIT